jgi:hypothetical protein
MRITVFGAAALAMFVIASEAVAEPPVVVLQREEAKAPSMVQPIHPVRPTAAKMIKGAERLVLKTVKIDVWKSAVNDDRAVLWIDPLLAGGGKFRFQYRF